MKDGELKYLLKVDNLPEKRGVRLEIEDEDLAIFKIEGEIFILSNICPHNHAPQIYNGIISNKSIFCPLHNWQFDLKTGKTLNNNSNIRVYEYEIINGELFVKVPKRFGKW